MAKKRAPNCPSLSLAAAIEKVECVYAIEGINTFTGEVAVKHIGYNGLNGASRRALGALRSYGLISGRGSDLRVSDDAVVIIADAQSPDQTERQASLRKCLAFNKVFKDLVEQFGQGSTLLSISAHLQKEYGFKTGAAKRTAKVFKDSVTLLHWGAPSTTQTAYFGDYAQAPANLIGKNPSQAMQMDSIDQQDSSNKSSGSQAKGGQPSKEDSFELDEGRVKLQWPRNISPENFEDFTDWLLIIHRRIARDVDGAIDFKLQKQEK